MSRQSNILQIWGNKESMNLNSMILTNILSSVYFKQTLFELKTYHEVIDEIYYRVTHLEPWEKGSRRTQGLTGMCGGVRGVGGGGIVSTAFCLLYKLYTLKLTRKQVMGLIEHQDSPFIRALGFMYVRYTQNPQDLFSWYSDYLDDEEELDVKAGGGLTMTIGQMLRRWLIRLEWFDTLFPRIPIPIQNEIMSLLRERYGNRMDPEGNLAPTSLSMSRVKRTPPSQVQDEIEEEHYHRKKVRSSRSRSRDNKPAARSRSKSRSPANHHHHHKKARSKSRSHSPKRNKKSNHRSSRSRSGSRKRRSRSKSRSRSRESSSKHKSSSHKSHKSHHHKRDKDRSRSKSKDKDKEKEKGKEREKGKEKDREREKDKDKEKEKEREQMSDGESEPGEIRSERKERKKSRERD